MLLDKNYGVSGTPVRGMDLDLGRGRASENFLDELSLKLPKEWGTWLA